MIDKNRVLMLFSCLFIIMFVACEDDDALHHVIEAHGNVHAVQHHLHGDGHVNAQH